jgi:hypothetical protein
LSGDEISQKEFNSRFFVSSLLLFLAPESGFKWFPIRFEELLWIFFSVVCTLKNIIADEVRSKEWFPALIQSFKDDLSVVAFRQNNFDYLEFFNQRLPNGIEFVFAWYIAIQCLVRCLVMWGGHHSVLFAVVVAGCDYPNGGRLQKTR